MPPIIPLFPGIPGGPELLVIVLLAVLLFGANKLPKLARSMGTAQGEFKKGRAQVEEELDEMTGSSDQSDDADSAAEPTATDEQSVTDNADAARSG